METERDAFVTSLAKFTFLDSVREIQQKNIDCIKTLIAVALHEGNHLRQSWGPVLNCVSQLARLQLFAAGAKSDDTYFPEPVQAPSVSRWRLQLWHGFLCRLCLTTIACVPSTAPQVVGRALRPLLTPQLRRTPRQLRRAPVTAQQPRARAVARRGRRNCGGRAGDRPRVPCQRAAEQVRRTADGVGLHGGAGRMR